MARLTDESVLFGACGIDVCHVHRVPFYCFDQPLFLRIRKEFRHVRKMVVVCWICYRFAAPSLKGIVKHMGNVHSFDPNFRVCCGIDSCSRTYTNFHSFKKHLYRKHRFELDCSEVNVSSSSAQKNNVHLYNNEDVCTTNGDAEDGTNSSSSAPSTFITMNDSLKRSTALFTLKAKEVHKVSQKALDGLMEDFTLLIREVTDSLETDVRQSIGNATGGDDISDVLDQCFKKYSNLNPFDGLNSKHLQDKYYCESLEMLVLTYTSCVLVA